MQKARLNRNASLFQKGAKPPCCCFGWSNPRWSYRSKNPSAATIPVNVECAKSNGISKEIREFCVPLCATIHLSGSIISVTSFAVAVLMMNGMDYRISTVLPFILMLGIAMVAAPGAPGGAIMSALPFLPMIGIPSDGGLASLMIALYLTQDSFGTAANISGDNAIAAIVDHLNKKLIKKESTNLKEKWTEDLV